MVKEYIWEEGKVLAEKFNEVLECLNIENVNDCERITLSYDELNYLIELGVVNINDYQNNSPSIRQLRNIAGYFQDAVFFGYIVSKDRDDCRISIDGITLYYDRLDGLNINQNKLINIINKKFHPDEFIIEKSDNSVYFWWD